MRFAPDLGKNGAEKRALGLEKPGLGLGVEGCRFVPCRTSEDAVGPG